MKINVLETHDRLLEFKKQSDQIGQSCLDCIRNRPTEFGNVPFYIFAHKRTLEVDERVEEYNKDVRMAIIDSGYKRKYMRLENVPTAKMIWIPRLNKPQAEENSMLFRCRPPSEDVEIIWIIPDRELFGQYNKDDMIESDVVTHSIYLFLNHKEKLMKKESDELPDETIKGIMCEIGYNQRMLRDINTKPKILEAF